MTRFLLLLTLLFSCTLTSLWADVLDYGWTGKLGPSIQFRLELQQNSLGIVAGATTYYRKNGKVSTIPVYGSAEMNEDETEVTFSLQEFDGTSVCGEFSIRVKNGFIEWGNWSLGDRTLEMNDLENVEINHAAHYLHPVRELSQAVGEYSHELKDPNRTIGGHCTITEHGGKLEWEITNLCPGIAEGKGISTFDCSEFEGSVGSYRFTAYIDENFIRVTRLPNIEWSQDELGWGAWSSLDGLYVRKGTSKPTVKSSATKNDMVMATDVMSPEMVTMVKQFDFDAAAKMLRSQWDASEEALCQSVLQLLQAKALPLSCSDLNGFNKVRSTQLDGSSIIQYTYFPCRFTNEVRAPFFRKTGGSQRRAGGLYRIDDTYLMLEGCWFIGGDQELYDDEHHTAGLVKKVAADKLLMLFPGDGDGFELYELKK